MHRCLPRAPVRGPLTASASAADTACPSICLHGGNFSTKKKKKLFPKRKFIGFGKLLWERKIRLSYGKPAEWWGENHKGVSRAAYHEPWEKCTFTVRNPCHWKGMSVHSGRKHKLLTHRSQTSPQLLPGCTMFSSGKSEETLRPGCQPRRFRYKCWGRWGFLKLPQGFPAGASGKEPAWQCRRC